MADVESEGSSFRPITRMATEPSWPEIDREASENKTVHLSTGAQSVRFEFWVWPLEKLSLLVPLDVWDDGWPSSGARLEV